MNEADAHRTASEWRDPLTSQELVTVLRALVEVAAGAADYDFGTVLDVYSDQARHHARSPLSRGESEQIISAVRASIPGTHDGSVWQSDVLFLDRYLFEARRVLRSGGHADGAVLADLLRSAADYVEARADARLDQARRCSRPAGTHQDIAVTSMPAAISLGKEEGE